MKFTMAIEKKNKVSIGRSEGHNARQHPTMSQLPEPAWFTPKGRHGITSWRQEVVEGAKGLAKRKDAVVAIEIVLQVGDQSDWRELPTAAHPHGKPKPGAGPKLKALMAGAKLAAIREFGEANIVSIDLHTDETTPHVHIVAVPVHQGKLQAAHWVNGAKKCAQLRARIHEVVSHYIECNYEKGAAGGAPHDPLKAAGGPKGPKPPEPRPGLLKRAVGAFDAFEELRKVKAQVEQMEATIKTMFGRLKRLQLELERAGETTKKEKALAASAERRASKATKRVKELEEQLEQLRPKVQDLEPAPAMSPARKIELGA